MRNYKSPDIRAEETTREVLGMRLEFGYGLEPREARRVVINLPYVTLSLEPRVNFTKYEEMLRDIYFVVTSHETRSVERNTDRSDWNVPSWRLHNS